MRKSFSLLAAISSVMLFSSAHVWAESPKPASKDKELDAEALPSPADMLKKLKADREAVKKTKQVAHITLGGMPIVDRGPQGFGLFSVPGMTMYELIKRFDRAREDKDVSAVLVTVDTGSGLSLSQAFELRAEFDQLRRAGKRVFFHADSLSTVDFYLASSATDVCLMPAGEAFMPGIGIETMFYKGAMEKVGIKADYIQIGEYKGAEEPYTRSAPSDELKGELTRLTKNLYDEIVDGISLSRNKSKEDVQRLIDDSIMGAEQLKAAGYVDHLVDIDGLRDMLKGELGGEVTLLAGYGEREKPEIDVANPISILMAMNTTEEETEKDKVAIIYANGVITDGEGGGGLLSESGIGSEPIRRAMRMAARDEKVKAIVLRIDSPGGSALASEVMWQAIRRVAKEKPVVISIGGMAASGGYYMSVAGDYIVADPASIVGSIGVVGGKMVLSELYDKVGLTTASFTQGRNAGMFSSSQEWDDRQKRMVRTWMRNTYEQFTDRIMETRTGKIKDVDKVARGRIFTSREAVELGMVDQLGGIETALGKAAEMAKLPEGKWDTKVLPPAPTLADILAGGNGLGMASPVKADAAMFLNLLPGDAGKGVVQFIQMGELLQKKPVVLMTPYVITVK
jgi:protease IV